MGAGAGAGGDGARFRVWWAAGVIVLFGLAAYHNSFSGPFVFDDPSSITSNPTIRHLGDLGAVLRTPRATVTAEGRPVVNLSLAINYAISKYDVWSYHALNLAIHILAGLVLFGVVRRTSEGLGVPGAASVLVALLWVVHPIQTEAVTYVIQRAESLMGLFYLLTLYGFIRYAGSEGPPRAERPRHGPLLWALLSILSCLLGMATKEAMVSAPVTVFLYDRTFVSGGFGAAWRRHRLLHGGLAATWLLLGYLMHTTGWNRGGSIGFGIQVSWWSYLLTQFQALPHYLALVFWPHPLIFEYGTTWVDGIRQVLPGAALVFALGLGSIWALWKRPALGFLGFWFFAMLAPTSLVPGTTQMIVEHRMYLALAAVLCLLVCGAEILPPAARRACHAIFGAAAVAFAVVTIHRNQDYRTAIGLWTKTVELRPRNVLAHTMLAQVLKTEGRPEEARRHFEEAVRLNPRFAIAQEGLGEILFEAGQTEQAILHYRAAIGAKPDYADAHDNLGAALGREGKKSEAIAEFREALKIKPDYGTAHYNLAGALADAGRPDEALAEYRRAVELTPDFAPARFNYANTLSDNGKSSEAVAQYEAALALQPAYPKAEYNLANTLLSMNRRPDAIRHLEAAVRLQPDYLDARYNLAGALFESGRLPEAALQYEAVLKLKPDAEDARQYLQQVRRRLYLLSQPAPVSPTTNPP